MTALQGLLRKEFFHIRRDRRTATVLVALPVVQVLLFGSAIRTDVDNVRLAVVDPVPTNVTLALRNRFTAAGVFRLVAVVPRTEDLDPLFETGAAQQAGVFSHDFAADVGRGTPAQLLLITDATEPNTGTLLQAYAEAVVNQWASELGRAGPSGPAGVGRAGPSVGRAGPFGPARSVNIVPQVRLRFNPTRASSNLFVPGLMAFVLTIICALMTAISLTREKETGTMEALLVSPLRPWEIIAGKVLPYLAVGFASLLLVLVEARFVFAVPVQGSVLLLLAEGLLYVLVSLAFGILISARTSSQRLAMMGVFLTTLLPNVLLSGFIFPVESMPAVLRWISFIFPGRWFVVIARGIMLKGIGIEYLWRETLYIALLATVLLAASVRSFRERLE
jgi:ABC-2 type transport system permease protein